MIKMITLECPKCGAALNACGKEIFFCGHCGAKIMLHNENEQVYHIIKENKNTYRYIDETEIAKIEAEKQLEIKKIETEEKKQNQKTESRDWLLSCIVMLSMFVFMFLAFLLIFLSNIIN